MLRRTARLMAANYFRHNVGRNGAALAYYLLFTLFPLLIFVSSLLGLLDLDVASITQSLTPILPREVLTILEVYLDYVAQTSSSSMLWFSLVFSIYFPMRAAKCLMDAVRRAYHLKKSAHPVAYALRQLLFTAVLLLAIALALVLSTLGQRVLGFFAELLEVSDWLLTLWHYLRFLLLAVIMFAALGALYAMSQDRRQPVSSIVPGAVAALAAWLAVSIGFSFYVENFANYTIVYGTLGAVVVLMVWLYLTATILIMGAELNAALRTARSGGIWREDEEL